MLEFFSTVFFLWCLYTVLRWLFPGKEVREQRRHLRREQKLGMLYPSPHPRDDGHELRQGIDFKMGGILQWKKVGGGMLLIYKPSVKDLTGSVRFWRREDEIQSGYHLPLRVHVADLGVLCVNAPMNGIFEACVKDGELSSGDALALLHTDSSYIEQWKAERGRIRLAEEAKKVAERERLRAVEAERRKEWEAGAAERERQAAEREKAEIASKLKEKQRRRELEEQVRMELIDSGELFGDQPKRPPIPREVVDAVYRRDGARCVYCGSTENLQLDHIIPFSKGGATSLENLQLLCQKCNLEKSNKIG